MKKNKNTTLNPEWKKNLLWTIVALAIAGVLFLAVEKKANAPINTVLISIDGIEGGRNLVSKKGVKKLFREYLGYDIEMSAIKDLDLRDMEQLLVDDERIKTAEIYIDNKNRLFIEIMQRAPIVRVFSDSNQSYYLDKEGSVIQVQPGQAIRVPIASGVIESFEARHLSEKSKSHLRGVYEVSKYIHDDEFLSALIEQIDVDSKGDITLIPKVGRQQLVFGDTKEVQKRFDKLKLLYKEGMPHLGWRRYDVLTLKYNNQNNEDYYLVYGEKSRS